MKLKIITFITIIIVMIISCYPKTKFKKILINESFYPYINSFKEGSTWTYKDINNNNTYIITLCKRDSIEGQIADNIINNEFKITICNTPFSNDNMEIHLTPSSFNENNINLYLIASKDKYIMAYFKDVYFINKSLNFNGKMYSNGLILNSEAQSSLKSLTYIKEISMLPNIGIISMKILDDSKLGSTTLNLVDYEVNL